MTGRKALAREFKGKNLCNLAFLRSHFYECRDFYKDIIKNYNDLKSQDIEDIWGKATLDSMIKHDGIGGAYWRPPKYWIDNYKNIKRAYKEAYKYYNARCIFLDDVLTSIQYNGDLPSKNIATKIRLVWSD